MVGGTPGDPLKLAKPAAPPAANSGRRGGAPAPAGAAGGGEKLLKPLKPLFPAPRPAAGSCRAWPFSGGALAPTGNSGAGSVRVGLPGPVHRHVPLQGLQEPPCANSEHAATQAMSEAHELHSARSDYKRTMSATHEQHLCRGQPPWLLLRWGTAESLPALGRGEPLGRQQAPARLFPSEGRCLRAEARRRPGKCTVTCQPDRLPTPHAASADIGRLGHCGAP